MKKLLLVAGATAVVVGGGVASARHYDQYQNKKQAAQVSAVATARKQQKAADAKLVAELAVANAALKTECSKGVVAYAKLSPVVQRFVPKPVCAPATQ